MSKPHESQHLTKRAKLFCFYYTQHYMLQKAYEQAGYAKARTMKSLNAWGLLKKPFVAEEIARLEAENREKYKSIIDRNVQELSRIAYGNVTDTIDMTTGMPVYRQDSDPRLIQDIELGQKDRLKIKHYNKLQAIDMLNRMMGAYQDRVDVTSQGASIQQAPIINYIVNLGATQTMSEVPQADVVQPPKEPPPEPLTLSGDINASA